MLINKASGRKLSLNVDVLAAVYYIVKISTIKLRVIQKLLIAK